MQVWNVLDLMHGSADNSVPLVLHSQAVMMIITVSNNVTYVDMDVLVCYHSNQVCTARSDLPLYY